MILCVPLCVSLSAAYAYDDYDDDDDDFVVIVEFNLFIVYLAQDL